MRPNSINHKQCSVKSLSLVTALSTLMLSQVVHGQSWECALDLQQGDRGSLSLNRDNESVKGEIVINRNDKRFAQDVEGRWLGKEIELTRFTAANSSQKMHGIAIKVGAEQVKIGGRFGDGLSGVWSADCDLAPGATITSASVEPEPEKESSKEGSIAPSTSMQTIPFRPSDRDAVEFVAKASHPDGIKSMSIFVDKKRLKQCASNECRATSGPLSVGKHDWYVIAESNSGVSNEVSTNQLIVTGVGVSTCNIGGLATGSAVAQSATARVLLTGGRERLEQRFDAGVYTFKNLQPGAYVLEIVSAGNAGLLISPLRKELRCGAGQTVRQNFEFN